jgi:HAD superfamily hydrolase (TIGR01549 family)
LRDEKHLNWKDDIKAILFDFAGTLVEGHLDVDACRAEAISLLNYHGFVVTRAQYDKAMEESLELVRTRRQLEIETPFETVIADTTKRLGIEVTHTLVESIEDLDFSHYRWRLKPGVREAILGLSDSKLLGVVSNSWSDSVLRVLTESGLSERFKTIVLSKDVGYRKPSRRIFIRALEDLGVAPAQVVFVGDTYIDDVVGPASVGMIPIWAGEQLRDDSLDLPPALWRILPIPSRSQPHEVLASS